MKFSKFSVLILKVHVPANKPTQSPLDDFLAFDGGGDPKQSIAEKNLMDRNQIVQTGLVSAFETNAANRNSFDYNLIQGINNNRFVTAEFIRGVEAMAGTTRHATGIYSRGDEF